MIIKYEMPDGTLVPANSPEALADRKEQLKNAEQIDKQIRKELDDLLLYSLSIACGENPPLPEELQEEHGYYRQSF